MLTKAILLAVALYAQSVYSSHYHGPTTLPVVLHSGYLADTQEVAAAKSAHLSTLSQESHGHHQQQGHRSDLRYRGPIAIPRVLHDGHIADTHEVAAAKAEHYAAVAKARAQAGDYHSGQHASAHHTAYHGPLAAPVVLPSGYIADTHDVIHAKQAHLQLLNKARHNSY